MTNYKTVDLDTIFPPTSYAPWWLDSRVNSRAYEVTHWRKGAESDDEVDKTVLSTAHLVAAFDAAARVGALCCARAMTEDDWGMGCAEDYDQIMQRAVYGELVYG